MKWILKLLPTKLKVWIYTSLHKDIADKGEYEDTELAHVNPYEVKILKELGGAGKVNPETGLRGYFGGGGSPAPAPAPSGSGTQTTISREAPGIESRKLALFDEAIDLAGEPISIPRMQVAGVSPLQQQALDQAAVTGVGGAAVDAGIASFLKASQTAEAPINVDAFMNPYESYVVQEINRQADIGRNRLAQQAIDSGAFGGGREGVALGELEAGRARAVGQVRAANYDKALESATAQRLFQTEAAMNVGQQLATTGGIQQEMAQSDIQQLGGAGQLQRSIAQEGLQAERATELARAYEPFQRIEFAKGIMTALPTTASQVTQASAPRVNPITQAVGTGITAAQGVNMLKGFAT
jgi:hypothetical protein